MKFGIREICDVVLKAKARQKIGNKVFYKDEPVIYFDTLKTSSMEGAATTVYAQGGRGNARLMAWEGERTVTFTMEDALISPEGFMILSGAGLIEADSENTVKQHVVETVVGQNIIKGTGESAGSISIKLSQQPYMPDNEGNTCYVMFVKDGEIVSEPYIPEKIANTASDKKTIVIKAHDCYEVSGDEDYEVELPNDYDSVIVDYYVERASGAKQIEITADKFGGNYYLEASTLFRTEAGIDLPAEFIIPNCKIQSNFTFSMASTGDPSTFTFTMDAFPDYVRFDPSHKVLAAIQIIEESDDVSVSKHRGKTPIGYDVEDIESDASDASNHETSL